MNNALDALYREELLELAETAKQEHGLIKYDKEAVRYNPLCGDTVKLRIRMKKNKITDISAQVEGCIICSASAAILCDTVRKQNLGDTMKLVVKTFDIIRTGNTCNADAQISLLSGVHRLPNRVRCALLSWEALESLVQ